jgi:ribose transport system substrate-binding protein
LPENRDAFFSEVIRGAERAAAESSAVLSIHSIDPYRKELEMASYTGVDGVVVCPYLEDKEARRQLDRLTTRRIPVVLINHNIPNEQPWPFIGTNNFDVGRKMGTIAGRSNGDGQGKTPVRLAVVYSDKSPGIFAERELVEMGITVALGERLSAPILGLKTGQNPLGAEEMLFRLLRTNPQINTIIFTDANDTKAAAQVLIDMNLVGRVQLVGFGNDPLIQGFIRKGIIAGSITVDPDRIGYSAIKALVDLKTGGYTSTSVDTGVGILDRENLDGDSL